MIQPLMTEKHKDGGRRKATLVVGCLKWGDFMCTKRARSSWALFLRFDLSEISTELEYLPAMCSATCSSYSPLVGVLCPYLWNLTPHVCSLVFSQQLKAIPNRFLELFLFVALSSYNLPHKFHPMSPSCTLSSALLGFPSLCHIPEGVSTGTYLIMSLLSGITTCCPMCEIVASQTLFSDCS